jgi:hypothetical protein
LSENATARSLERNPLAPATLLDRLLATPAHGEHGPDDAAVHAIHRGPDGFIPLAVKTDGRSENWRELGAVPVGQPFLPGLLAQLARDGYFAINSAFCKRPGRWEQKQRNVWRAIDPKPHRLPVDRRTWAQEQARIGPAERVRETHWERVVTNPDTGLPYIAHRNATLRWLNAAYCDLDCYKVGLDIGDAIGAVISMAERGELPWPSLFARSGRGVWVFWHLVDAQNPTDGEATIQGATHRPGTPQRAWPRAMRLYAKVQGVLVRQLAHLGADFVACDAAHLCPFPGTEKTGGTYRVHYWPQVLSGGGMPCYTLAQLATSLGLELRTREHPVIEAAFTARPHDGAKDPVKSAAGRKGWLTKWGNQLRCLETLLQLRGGRFDTVDGVSRNRAALFYARVLRGAGMSRIDVSNRVAALGARCRMEPHEIRSALAQARKKIPAEQFLSTDQLITSLRVTDAELSYLRAAGGLATAKVVARPGKTVERRDAILDICFELGGVPSYRRMEQLLQTRGHGGNFTTVRRDYKALALTSQAKRGRPPKLPFSPSEP